DSLKALDLERPIREADIRNPIWHAGIVPQAAVNNRSKVPANRDHLVGMPGEQLEKFKDDQYRATSGPPPSLKLRPTRTMLPSNFCLAVMAIPSPAASALAGATA